MTLPLDKILQIDHQHIWHPYSSFKAKTPIFSVDSAHGSKLNLSDGRTLIDGMSSWWSTIHGYNHPVINEAIKNQVDTLSHVMFGGLTHSPAAELTQKLVELTPPALSKVFLADSGSVSVEVAIKMAIQYWLGQNKPEKSRFLSFRKGYHGDTLGAMSLCDPVTGMHHLFNQVLAQQIFAESPQSPFGETAGQEELATLEQLVKTHHTELAAVIIEPIVQGAGGMNFYSADILKKLRALCDEYSVLLIFDEIATGFGRTGKMFALEHAELCPDILCLGKSLTAGYMTMAATLCTEEVASGVCATEAGVFMHGPTFMGNPLACSAAIANINLLQSSPWQTWVSNIEHILSNELAQCTKIPGVHSVRTLGAIGVVELDNVVEMDIIQPMFVEHGIWIRPFGKLVYTMPAFNISEEELKALCTGLRAVLEDYLKP